MKKILLSGSISPQSILCKVLAFCSLTVSVTTIDAAILNIKDPAYGAVGDGDADDSQAFEDVFAAASDGDIIELPAGDYRILTKKESTFRTLPAGVTIRGAGPDQTSIWVGNESTEGTVRTLFAGSDDVIVEDLAIERMGNFHLRMLRLGTGDNQVYRNVHFIGNRNAYSAHCDAILVLDGVATNVLLDGIKIERCSYGLLSPSSYSGTLSGMVVRDSTFINNYATDLEFNSPAGTTNNILVDNCEFLNNLSSNTGNYWPAGWAVGFAKVKQGRITNNIIENYGSCGIHIEDESMDIIVSHNRLINTSTQADSPVFIVNDVHRVMLENNFIDCRNNPRGGVFVFLVQASEDGNGNAFPMPSNVDIDNNVILHGQNTAPWALQTEIGVTPEGNVMFWEAEEIVRLGSSDSVSTLGGAQQEFLSSGSVELLNANSVGDYVTYELRKVGSGIYDIAVGVETGTNRGVFEVEVEGEPLGGEQDTYSSTAGPALKQIGRWEFAGLDFRDIKFIVSGKNSASSDYDLGIDYIRLTQAPQNKPVVQATADTYTRGGGYSSDHYYDEPKLIVKNTSDANYDRRTFIRFDCSGANGINGIVESGKLILHPIEVGPNTSGATYQVLLVSNDSWNEQTVDANNEPVTSSLLKQFSGSAVHVGVPLEIDLAPSVLSQGLADGELSVAIVQTTVSGTPMLIFDSLESANPPLLELKVSSEVVAEADTYIRGGSYATANYGSSNELWLKETTGEDYDRSVLLRFDLTSVSGLLEDATLVLTPSALGTDIVNGDFSVVLIDDDDDGWNESEVSWSSQLSEGAQVGFIDGSQLQVAVPFDVVLDAAAVRQAALDEKLSLAIIPLNWGHNNWAQFYSKETAFGARLRVNFEPDRNIRFNSFNFDNYTSQPQYGYTETSADAQSLHEYGNQWVKYHYRYMVTENTVLEFTIDAPQDGEIIGIGLDNDDSYSGDVTNVQLGGSQTDVGHIFIQDYNDYDDGTGPKSYTIPIGSFFVGDMQHITFVADADSGPAANITFSDIRLYEAP